jgi:hypothetical protein
MNFKIVFKTIELCIRWWIKNFDITRGSVFEEGSTPMQQESLLRIMTQEAYGGSKYS